MKKLATAIAILALGFMWTPGADAQITDVFINEINEVPQDSIDALNAGGAEMPEADVERLMQGRVNVALGDTVRFGAVVLSNPLLSGLASLTDDDVPGRIHIFVRDTVAATTGPLGMDTQIVDAEYFDNDLIGVEIGDVIAVEGVINMFFGVIQIDVLSFLPLGDYVELGYSADILDPVSVTTSDVNMSVGASGEIQSDWSTISSYQNQYVIFEDATVLQRDISSDRPSWYVSNDDGMTGATIRDVSLRYRNDQSDYPDPFLPRASNDDFVPPPPGSLVDLQGFLVLHNFTPFGDVGPHPYAHAIAPFEDDDLVLLESPPIISNVSDPGAPDTNPVSVTADVVADAERAIAAVNLHYYTSASPDTSTVAAGTPTDNTYPFEIPGAGDGDFVTFWVEATDDEAAVSRSQDLAYRVLADGVDSIEDIQMTASGGVGVSPFNGSTLDMNINATVQTDGANTGIWAVQDNVDLDPWSGIEIGSLKSGVTAPALGDDVTITRALVRENFDLTRLDSVEVTINGAGTPYPHKVVSTAALADLDIAEAHEGMLLRFDNVTIISANEGFGEWSFSSDGTEDNLLKADDASTQIPDTFAVDTFMDGDEVTFIQGLLSFTFSDYKIFPLTPDDIGDVIVGVEEVVAADGYVLHQNYPNPFSGSTSITLTTPGPGDVRLAVYDVLGRHVRTLIDGPVPAGEHTVEFDRTALASGLYMYRLETDSNSLVRTMTIVR